MRISCFLLAVSGFAATTVLGAVPVIYNLGVLPSGTQSQATAVSGDGKFVTGFADVVALQTNTYAFRWSVAGGMVNLGVPLGSQNSYGRAVNQDGSVIAGILDNKIFRWTSLGGMQDLGIAGSTGSNNSPVGISSDGSVIVGTCGYSDGYPRAFRWDAINNFVMLHGGSNNVGVASTFALGVSGNGLVTVGTYPGLQYGPFACRWNGNSLAAAVNGLHMWGSTATAVSRNGLIIIGRTYDSHFFRTPAPSFTATVDHGLFVGNGPIEMVATNYDGTVAVGTGSYNSAAYWSTAAGMRDLNVFLPQLGANISGWVLREATGVSNDGTAIVGWGTYGGATRAFYISGMPCISIPNIYTEPSARSVCAAPGASTTISVEADSPSDMTYQWSVETPAGSGHFQEITGPHFADSTGTSFDVAGWETPNLTISALRPSTGHSGVVVHVLILNLCGQLYSIPARVMKCDADLDCNEMVDDADFVIFVASYNELLCPEGDPTAPAYCPGDLNSDHAVDDADFLIFASAYSELLCVN